MPVRNHKQPVPAPGCEEPPRFESSAFTATVTDKAQDASSFVGEKAEQATMAVGTGMESAAQAIRDHGPACGALHNAGEAIADKLEGGGRYLETHGLKDIGEDVTNLIRRNPIPALLIGVGIGALIAQLVRR